MKRENEKEVKSLLDLINRLEDDIDFIKYFGDKLDHKATVSIKGRNRHDSWRELSLVFPNKLLESQVMIAILHDKRVKLKELLSKLEKL